MEKLDKKDRKILTILAQNPRISYTELAKHILLSKNATKYRLDNLIKEGIVERILPIIHYLKLGLTTYDVFLKCNPVKETKQNIERYLSTQQNIIWSASVFGQHYDYFFELICKTPFELDKIMTEIIQLLGESFQEFRTIIGTRRVKIQPLVEELQEAVTYKPEPAVIPNLTPVKLDALDKQILQELCKDGRATYLDIALKLKTTLQTVRNRMNRMIENTTILKFMPEYGYKKLGYVNYILLLKTRQVSEDLLKVFFDKQGTVKLALHVVNANELELFICVHHPDQLEKLINDLKEEFPGKIAEVEFMHMTKELKLDFFPEGI